MPVQQRLGTNDCERLKDRRKPPIQLDEEPAIAVREPDPAQRLSSQNVQLMPECHVLRFKPALRLERRGDHGQDEAEQCKHRALTVSDSFS